MKPVSPPHEIAVQAKFFIREAGNEGLVFHPKTMVKRRACEPVDAEFVDNRSKELYWL